MALSERSIYWPGWGVDEKATFLPSGDQSGISAARGAPGPCDATSATFDGRSAPVSGS
jgi:hypothetical protein